VLKAGNQWKVDTEVLQIIGLLHSLSRTTKDIKKKVNTKSRTHKNVKHMTGEIMRVFFFFFFFQKKHGFNVH